MTDLLLMIVVIGAMVLALGLDFAALFSWMFSWILNRWRSARHYAKQGPHGFATRGPC